MLPQTSKLISLLLLLLLCLPTSSFAQENNSPEYSKEGFQKLIDTIKTSKNSIELTSTINEIAEIAVLSKDAEAATPFLIEIIKTSKDGLVLTTTVKALGNIAKNSKDTVQKLIGVIKTSKDKDNDNDALNCAIQALGMVGKDAKDAVPFLTEILQTNNDSDVLSSAIDSFVKIGDAKDTIPILIESLKIRKADPQVSSSIADAFGIIGKDAVPSLIEVLKTSKDWQVIANITQAFGIIQKDGKDAVPVLIEILKTSKDEQILHSAIAILGYIGKDAKDAVPVLIEILKTSKDTRLTAIRSLGRIGNEARDAVPDLIEILKADNYKTGKDITIADTNLLGDTLTSLQGIGKDAKTAVPHLFKLLKNESSLASLKSTDQDLFGKDLESVIYSILTDLTIGNDFSENENIRESFDLYKNNLTEEGRSKTGNVITTLEQREALQTWKWLNDFITKHPKSVWTAVSLLSLFIIWLVSFCVRPVWLVSIHEKLWLVPLLSELKIPALPLIPFICLRTRPLDAWVKHNSAKVNASFQAKETVKERSLHIPVKVSFNGDKNTEFIAQNFQKVFTENKSDILIHGDGGSGKTSLVCRIAQWAMDGSLFNKHIALPVLIESNVKDIQKKINEEIKELTDSTDKISDALQKALLRKKRILLIVDGLSELDETTKQQIVNNTEINAVIYTSRNDEIKDIAKIETNNVADESLYHFISTYIEKFIENLAEKPQFQSNEIHEYCANLSKLVGEKGISVLLAKLYAEQLVAEKEGTIGEALPKNIPELMLRSINVLHKKTPSDNIEFSDVIKASEIIANECLKKDYRPLPAAKDKVKEALANAKISDDVFKHLRDKLKIIENKGTDESEIAFKIDPLAEYLAADYSVKENSYKADKWKVFLEDAKNNNAKHSIKGFLVAVKDCYEINKDILPFVVEELTKLIESEKLSNEDKTN
jgi:HEAT repeat protein